MDKSFGDVDKILRENIKPKDVLYGIFDGAIIEDLWLNIELWDLDSASLFRGNYEKIAEAIPYVIEIDESRDKDACELLLGSIGRNSSLFIVSNLTLKDITNKMQYFYHIKTSSGESALRRFYDPRVFSDFISGMSTKNRLLFFKNVSCFFSEANDGEKLISYGRSGDELKREVHTL